MMDKILDKIIELKNNLDRDWKPDLEDINIWTDVEILYEGVKDNPREGEANTPGNLKANTILAFIVMAYANKSSWIDMNTDRYENKIKIMSRLAGENWRVEEDYVDAITGLLDPFKSVIDWFIETARDWRWGDIVTNWDQHAKARILARNSSNSKDVWETSKMLQEAKKNRQDADDMYEALKKEFVVLDTILDSEDRPRATDQISDKKIVDQDWTMFIASLHKEKRGEVDQKFSIDSDGVEIKIESDSIEDDED